MIVGADIGGHHIAAALVDAPRTGIRRETLRHRDVNAHADRDTLIAAWAQEMDAIVEAAATSVIGIGVAIPGPFDYRAGIAHFEGSNAKFCALRGVDVAAALRTAMRHVTPVRFINDATAFAVGCQTMGLGNGARRILGVTLGTGLGSAFLEDGIPLVDDVRVPNGGCLWDMPYRGSIADDYVSARALVAEAEQVLGRHVSGVAEIAEIARGDAPEVAAIFARYGDALGEVIAPWVARFDVEAIVLGGRISGALDLFGQALRLRLGVSGSVPPISHHFETEDAAIIGSAMLFDTSFWSLAQSRLPSR